MLPLRNPVIPPVATWFFFLSIGSIAHIGVTITFIVRNDKWGIEINCKQ